SMLLWVGKRISYSHATIRIGKAGPIGKGRQESAVGPAGVHAAFGVQRLRGGSAPERPVPGGSGGRGAVRLDARPAGRGPDHDEPGSGLLRGAASATVAGASVCIVAARAVLHDAGPNVRPRLRAGPSRNAFQPAQADGFESGMA